VAVSILIMVLVPCELPLNRALPDDVGKMETLGGAACVKVGTCTSTRTYKHKHMHKHKHKHMAHGTWHMHMNTHMHVAHA
jgi:hypothetical protein